MTTDPQTAEETIKPTLGEDITELFSRVAKLNDIASALLAPAWGSEQGIIPPGHPLYVGELAAPAVVSSPLPDQTALDRVRALHQPIQRGPFTICAHCSGWDGKWRCLGVVTDHPCATLRALDGAPDVELRRLAAKTQQPGTETQLASLAVNAANALHDEKRHYEIACQENAQLRAVVQQVRESLASLRNRGADGPTYYDRILADLNGEQQPDPETPRRQKLRHVQPCNCEHPDCPDCQRRAAEPERRAYYEAHQDDPDEWGPPAIPVQPAEAVVQHAPGTAILCPDCHAKGFSICMTDEQQPAAADTDDNEKM